MNNPVDLVRYLTKRRGEIQRIIEDYPQGGYQRELDIIETLLDLIEDGPIEHFWTAVERGWDIEPRTYFEDKAVPMGFKSAVEMAVHHMWKRHAKDWPAPLSGPVDASGEPTMVSAEEIEHMKRDTHFDPLRERLRGQVRTLREIADGINRYLSSPAQCSVDAASKFQHAIRAAAAVPSSPAQPTIRAFVKHLWDECHDGGNFEKTQWAAKLDTLLALPPSSPVADSPPYMDPEWLPETRVDCYRAGWEAARKQYNVKG